MTIRTISKQHTGGAMERKDRPEWTDGRLGSAGITGAVERTRVHTGLTPR